MSKKSSGTDSQNKNPNLVKSKNEVDEFLKIRIQLGKQIYAKNINSESDLENAQAEEDKWHVFNVDYLKHAFDTSSIADEYDGVRHPCLTMRPSFGQLVENYKKRMQQLINKLESICERLSLFKEKIDPSSPSQVRTNGVGKIFIVHGHDETLKHKVARFVNKLGLDGVILDEQPNSGMTVIEKFEQHASDAQYAIILLTYDDIGHPKEFPDQAKPRARQNAIAELGYFTHALGRKNIAILCSEEIELPSDFRGVLYLPVKGDEWELRLAREMKAAGLDIDMNKL